MLKLKLPKVKFPNKSGDNDWVALDIGTEYVKALVGRIENNQFIVYGVGKQRQKLSDMHAGSVTDISGVINNCDLALTQAENMADLTARNAIVGIAGELVKGTTTTVRYQREQSDLQIDAKELKDIIGKVQSIALKKAKQEISFESNQTNLEVQLVNAAVVDVNIDGYRVTNPLGFKGRDVAIEVYNCFAPMVHIGALQTIANSLDLNLVNIFAEPFAVARSVNEENQSDFGAIFIDIGGGTTDIAIVSNGGVQGTKMFAIGGRSFTKTIASVLGKTFEESEDIKLLFANNNLSHSLSSKVKDIVDSNTDVWRSGVELSIQEFENLDHLPNRILLCGGGSKLPEIKEFLSDVRWLKGLGFIRKPRIDLMNDAMITRVIDKTGKLEDIQFVTAMGLANLAIDQHQSRSPVDAIWSHFNRSISI